MANWWLRCNRCALLDQRTILNRNVGDVGRYNFAGLLCPRHCRPHHHVQRHIQLLQAVAGEGGLLPSHLSQVAFSIDGTFQIVLAVADEYQMSHGLRFGRLQFGVVLVLLRWIGIFFERTHQTGGLTAAIWEIVKSNENASICNEEIMARGHTHWSQLKSHLACGATTVFVVHEFNTGLCLTRFTYKYRPTPVDAPTANATTLRAFVHTVILCCVQIELSLATKTNLFFSGCVYVSYYGTGIG